MSGFVIGTAGHVDHGKTALVAALTGTDTDRLPEEKARGISIELGFARLDLAGTSLSLVDVPGHERFVRHMVAGAGGIDGYLLCVAADDGIMPQTLEHLAILDLLGVHEGVVAVTKCDLVEPDRAIAAVRRLVGDGVGIVPVAAPLGTGIGDLRAALHRLADRLVRRRAAGPARLFVDRVFSVPGAGTVATGTLWGSELAVGDRVSIHPSGARGRVRALQVHDDSHERAGGGRVAANLAGVSRGQAPRGSVIVRDGDPWVASRHLDVSLRWLAAEPSALTTRRRLQVFHGTAETGATCVLLEDVELAPGDRGYVQLRLDAPVIARAGDPLVLRSADRRTVGGATVVDPAPERHGKGARVADRLRTMERGAALPQPQRAAVRAPKPPAVAPARQQPAVPDDRARAAFDAAARAGLRAPTAADIAGGLGIAAGDAEAALARLASEGRVRRVGDHWFVAETLDGAVAGAVALLRGGPRGIGDLRDLWGVGRRHALLIAAYLDRSGVTLRRGEQRVLRRSHAAGSGEDPETDISRAPD